MKSKTHDMFKWDGKLHLTLPHWVGSGVGDFVDNCVRSWVDENMTDNGICSSIYAFSDLREYDVWRKKP